MDGPAATHTIQPQAFDDLPVIEPVLMMNIGSAEASEDYALADVRALDVDDLGNVFILEQSRGISIFDSTGAFVRRFAPLGPGPGELRHPRSLSVGGDTVFVLADVLKYFDRSTSDYLGEARARDVGSVVNEFMASDHIQHTRRGIAIRRLRSEGWTQRDAPSFTDSEELRFLDINTGRGQSSPHRLTYVSHRLYGSRSISGPPLGGARPKMIAVSDGRVITTHAELFDIGVFGADGEMVERVVSHVPRVSITRNDLDDIESGLALLAASPDELRSWKRGLAATPRARTRPAIDRIIASPDGTMLIRRPDVTPRPYAHADPTAVAVWQLLSPEWDPIASLVLPLRFEPRVFRNCHITGTMHDADGVPSVAQYLILTTHGERSPLTRCYLL